jgi:integrase
VDKSTKTDNREAAEALRIKEEQRLLNRSIFGERATVTFVEAAVSFMENGGEARFLAPIIKHFGKRRTVNSIGQADIDAAAKAIYPTAKPSTRDRQVYSPVSAVLRHGAKRDWCNFIVLERPRYNNNRVRYLTVSEAEALVSEAAPHLRPLLIFMFGTGARVSEALYLQWSQIDHKLKQVNFEETKNYKSRGVSLSERTYDALSGIKHRVGPVFLTNRGKPYKYVEDCGGQIKTGFNGACRRAKIKNFTPHDCRHTWATWHYAANRDVPGLQGLGGWASIEMVMRYAHVNVEHMAPSIKAMGW